MNNDFGLDTEHSSNPESLWRSVRRRVAGRYPTDPFGLDPQLCDLSAPLVRTFVRVRVTHGDRIPQRGPAVILSNRGLGLVEPAALAVAVREVAERRLRVVGVPNLPVAGTVTRRLGGISGTHEDLTSALLAGHLVAVPLSPTWVRTGAGTPPLDLLQAMTPYPVVPVAVRAVGPLPVPVGWHIRVGTPITLDPSYDANDPLGAAELAESGRAAIASLLAGEEPEPERTEYHASGW
jgi:hypothetical protein